MAHLQVAAGGGPGAVDDAVAGLRAAVAAAGGAGGDVETVRGAVRTLANAVGAATTPFDAAACLDALTEVRAKGGNTLV
jgi:hypothetical protein